MIIIGVNAYNLVLGPARLYLAPFGTTPPAPGSVTPNGPNNPPSSPWTDVGGTSGGVTLTTEGTLTNLEVDQVIMPVGARQTALNMTVETTMAEVTLANMNAALNGIMTSSTNAGYISSDITVTSAATQPNYTAMIIDGWAPSGSAGQSMLRRYLVYKALATPKVSMVYDKKAQAGFQVTWTVFYVSNSVNPLTVLDEVV
jgi:hypothetical protein